MNKYYKALEDIVSMNMELQAIEFLLSSHKTKHHSMRSEYHDARCCLKLINKVNASKNKDKQQVIDKISSDLQAPFKRMEEFEEVQEDEEQRKV